MAFRYERFLNKAVNVARDGGLLLSEPKFLIRTLKIYQLAAIIGKKNIDVYHSQFGQDIAVSNVFFPQKKEGVFIDVGARCGVINSNTLALERNYNWWGLLVEPNSFNRRSLEESRTSVVVPCAVSDVEGQAIFFEDEDEPGYSKLDSLREGDLSRKGAEVTVEVATIGNLMRTYDISEVDYLDIDVEGNEMAALEGLKGSEDNVRVISVETRPEAYYGVTDKLATFGFAPYFRLGVDTFYVRLGDIEAFDRSLGVYEAVRGMNTR